MGERHDLDVDSYRPEDVESYTFSEENFYTRSTDHRGHFKSYRHGPGNEVLTLPPHLHGALTEMRQQWPQYRTNADIVRDALVHLVHMRGEQVMAASPKLYNSLQQVQAYAELERLEVARQFHAEAVEKIEKVLGECTSERELDEALAKCRMLAYSLDMVEYVRRANSVIERYSVRLGSGAS